MSQIENYFQEVLKFWFEELNPAQWFSQNPLLDEQIKKRFEKLHTQASRGELFEWRQFSEGRLAEILILDQFSRNMYRGTAMAFAFDSIALILAQEAVLGGHDQLISLEKRTFMYLPFMHSESPMIHESAEKLFSTQGLENALDFEIRHRKIIDRFGRYPHRNQILGRESSVEELEFLKQANSSF